MRVVIAGGHGQIALLFSRLLAGAGHQPVGLIRSADQTDDVVAAGAEARVIDLEQATVAQLAMTVAGADAVVFAAGAGPSSGAGRKWTVDRDGATKLISAARGAGVARYLLVSAMGADGFDPASDEVFQIYLRAKSEADAALRDSGLDWTIVRPGGLTDDEPTGSVLIARETGRGTVPRADVAAVLLACLLDDVTIGAQFEVISGDTPIAEAVGRVDPVDS